MSEIDDLDRRMDARIARALRMLAEMKYSGRSLTGDFVAVADALDPPEPELKPCPFCGAKPEFMPDRICCESGDCQMQGFFTVEQWNRRAEVPHG